jgi:di/tripeptidase
MNRFLFLLFVLTLSLFSCKKEGCTDEDAQNFNENATQNDGSCVYSPNDSIKIQINPVYNGFDLHLDSVYNTIEGYGVKFTTISFFISNLNNQSDTLNTSSLFDFREKGRLLLAENQDFNTFNQIQGNIGVGPANNHGDPSAFNNESDLNIENAGLMHWSWNTGYIFVNIEGKVDTLSSGIFNHNFSFHIGTDAFLQNFSFDNISWAETGVNEHTLFLELDLSSFLNAENNAIDLKDEYLTHSNSSQQSLSEKVVANFVNAFNAP